MSAAAPLRTGARNLLVDCAGLAAGDDLLIVHEDPDLGWYDLDLPMAVAAEAREIGISPHLIVAGAPGDSRNRRAAAAVKAARHVMFFARIGDQDRFAPPVPDKTVVMCYCRNARMLASSYGTTSHAAMTALKTAVDQVLLAASEITIACPLGTEIAGTVPRRSWRRRADVSVRRFPLGVPQPIPAAGFSGRVALGRYLTPTGSQPYEPASLVIDSPVFAEVDEGRITGFIGERTAVASVGAHYDRVADTFSIDRDAVHSWHAGIHPGCSYDRDAATDPDRWSNTVFTHPRFLHFHTCGAYAPGEICWMVLDHTVDVDGVALWKRGRLQVESVAALRECLAAHPELRALFDAPDGAIGLAGRRLAAR
jgi:hypothetical protein